jgi:hypothetical protein
VLSGEAKIPILKSGLTRTGLEPTIYRTQGELANYYNTNAVVSFGGHDHCLIEHSAGRHDACFFSTTWSQPMLLLLQVILHDAASTNFIVFALNRQGLVNYPPHLRQACQSLHNQDV